MNLGSETEFVEFKKSTGEHREAMEAISASNSTTSTDKTPINTDKTPINTGRIPQKDRTRLILDAIAQQDSVANGDIAELLGLGPDRTKEILRQMVSEGLLVKTGNRKATRYRLP